MNDEPVTLVRYGLMGHVGRFVGDFTRRTGNRARAWPARRDPDGSRRRARRSAASPSQLIQEKKLRQRSREANAANPSTLVADDWADRPRLVRAALPADLENYRQAEGLRGERFEVCRKILSEGNWPPELLDVEPLLDLDTTVLHLLGPSGLDLARLRAEFRVRCDFHVVFEYLARCAGCSLGGAAEAFSVPARARAACRDCAAMVVPSPLIEKGQ